MSDGISKHIEQIRKSALHFHGQYLAERSKNELLIAEIETLKNSIEAKNAELKELSAEVSALKEEIKTTQNHNEVSVPKETFSESEIDDLVKEIDYCIARLKQ